MARYGLVIDEFPCTGCYACVIACASENSTRPGISRIRIQEHEEGEYPEVSRRYTPLLCQQCGKMPCAKVCPSGAISTEEGGVVHIDPDRCLCCDNPPCTGACPFNDLQANKGRRSYFAEYLSPLEKEAYEAHKDGLVEKCTLCGLLQGLEIETDTKTVVSECLKRGILVNATGEHVLRFVAPLMVGPGEIDALSQVLDEVLP